MDIDIQKYFEVYEDLFATDGWKQLVVEIKDSIKEVDSVASCANVEDLFFRRGKLDILLQISSFEEAVASRKKQLELDSEDSPNPLED